MLDLVIDQEGRKSLQLNRKKITLPMDWPVEKQIKFIRAVKKVIDRKRKAKPKRRIALKRGYSSNSSESVPLVQTVPAVLNPTLAASRAFQDRAGSGEIPQPPHQAPAILAPVADADEPPTLVRHASPKVKTEFSDKKAPKRSTSSP